MNWLRRDNNGGCLFVFACFCVLLFGGVLWPILCKAWEARP